MRTIGGVVLAKLAFVLKEVFQWVFSIGIALVVALAIRAYVFEPVLVDGHSMDNTLADGQRLFQYKLGYKFSEPKRGDIIVLKFKDGVSKYTALPDPTEIDYIKRVIGLPGDKVDIKDNCVYINGEKLDEPYAKGNTIASNMKLPIDVPEGKVFVLGDNRERSSDSRAIGFIDMENIRGKAVFRIWPIKDFGVVK